MAKKPKSTNEEIPTMEDANALHFFKPPVPIDILQALEAELQKKLESIERDFSNIDFPVMTDAQRRRLLGAGVRRYGFILKTFAVASANLQYVPPFLNMKDFADLVEEITVTRNITICVEQILRIVTDILLLAGDDAFRLALMYYNSARDASRRGVPGAQAVFRTLELFFRRGRRTDEEPTIPEIERDVRALLHGKKDGEVVVKAEAKHKTASHREVVDTAHKHVGAFKEKTQGRVCSECGCENGSDYKFCKNCGGKL